jgi:hypothetical protein
MFQGKYSHKWTYLCDHSRLIKTLEKYVDYNKLQPNGKPNARLIATMPIIDGITLTK